MNRNDAAMATVDSAAPAAVDSVAATPDSTYSKIPDTIKKAAGNNKATAAIKKPRPEKPGSIDRAEPAKPAIPTDDDYKNLTRGNIAHNIPRRMQVDEWFDAMVSVSKAADTAVIMSRMPKRGTIVSTVLVGKSVSIRLIDPTGENFTIRDLNTEKQQVDNLTGTTWEFRIKPILPGENQQLRLIAKTAIGDSERDFTIYDTTVDVETTLTKSVWKFTARNWAFITFGITVILIPAITMLRKRRKKMKADIN